MEDCLFCKIAAGEIPSDKVYEDDRVLVFKDIAPAAPIHLLVVLKAHIMDSAAQITPENADIVSHVFCVIAQIAKAQGFDGGYRVLTNVGELAGQTVNHLHFHVLSGKKLDD